MGKIISMTYEEIRNNYDVEAAIEAAESAPEYTLEELGFKPGKPIARGFAAFKEYINREGRPKAKDPKVSISFRIPQSMAVGLRATGPGWQTRVSDFVVKGINSGELVPQNTP
ncbi:MAG: BrnA antitoxin family protein [Treponema sp.]|jgi:uncharacterized protein (DUF4415 family)|nr:BrnA antitoxin family protein [Treponema sp.]